MNNEQRKRLKKIQDQISDVFSEIEEIKDEEEVKLDNLPEGLQDSEKGQNILACFEILQEAIDNLELVGNCLEEVIEQ